jgi:F0F1-type ATP synthase membrane subunit a
LDVAAAISAGGLTGEHMPFTELANSLLCFTFLGDTSCPLTSATAEALAFPTTVLALALALAVAGAAISCTITVPGGGMGEPLPLLL